MIPAFINLASTDNYLRFGLKSSAHITLYNGHATNNVEFSFDGITQHGILPAQVGFTLLDTNVNEIYFRSLVAGSSGIVYCWGHGERRVIYPSRQAEQIGDSPNVPSSFKTMKGIF
jgi:hypothetical protein